MAGYRYRCFRLAKVFLLYLVIKVCLGLVAVKGPQNSRVSDFDDQLRSSKSSGRVMPNTISHVTIAFPRFA
jgi:hypothetical protein